MKKNYIILLSIEVLMLLFLIFNIFISSIFTSANVNYILFWLIILAILILTVGFEKARHLYKTDIIQLIFIYTVTYLVITYLFGLFFGFIRSPYTLTVKGLTQSLLPALILMFAQELTRYIIVSKSKEKKIFMALMMIIFIAFEIVLGIKGYSLQTGIGIFEFLVILVIPTIVTNLLLTYICYKGGYKPVILYRLILEISLFIIPIYPELGIYIGGIFDIVFPLIVFLNINSFYAKTKAIVVRSSKISKFLFWIPTTVLFISMIMLISGLFKVHAIAIATGSMEPNIKVGDAVIIEKLNDEEIKKLEIGQVIVYENERKMIVHRIVDLFYQDGTLVFQTKGDNNEEADTHYVKINHVKGAVRYRMPYIGYPSVWLGQLMK